MRKLTIATFLLLFVASAMAQNVINIDKLSEENPLVEQEYLGKKIEGEVKTSMVFTSPSSTRTDIQEVAWSFTSALDDYVGNSGSRYYTALFQDSVQQIFEDPHNPGQYSLSRVRRHSIGQAFTPFSNYLEYYYSVAMTDYNQPYTVDTVWFYYNYDRYTTPDIVDTLIIDVFKSEDMLYYTDNGIPIAATARFDIDNFKGRQYSYEDVRLLTPDDSIGRERGWGAIEVPLANFERPNGGPVAITWTYKSGKAFTTEDTINGDFNKSLPHSDLNHFFFLDYIEDTEDIGEYNNGLYIFSWTNIGGNVQRWVPDNTYGALYWRGNAFSDGAGGTSNHFPTVVWKITFDADFIGMDEDITDNVSLKCYPNPVNKADQINLDFELTSAQDITVELYDLVGNQISVLADNNFASGSHTLTQETGQLNSGMYLVKVTTGNVSKSYRFVVK